MESSFAGVDWASEKHDVVVQNAAGEELLAASFAHDEAGLRSLCRQLVRLSVRLVAIERPDGVLVERLLDAGLGVLAIASQPGRRRHATATAQPAASSDAFDAFVLAELARTDHHRFRVRRARPRRDPRPAGPDPRPGGLGRNADRAGQPAARRARAAAGPAPQRSLPRSTRRSPWPSCSATPRRRTPSTSARADWPASWPAIATAAAAPHTSCCSAWPRPLGAAVRRRGRSAPLDRARHVAALHPLVAQIRELSSEIAHTLDAHPDGPIFRSLFRDPKSSLTAAALVAETGDCRSRYPSAEALVDDAGQARSPSSPANASRPSSAGCDKRLRRAVSVLADSSRHHNPWAADIYQRARQRGRDHPHAIRILGRAWCASSGAAGTTTPPTTQPAIAPSSSTAR